MQSEVLLTLSSNRLIVDFGGVLETGHEVCHIVGVEGVQLVAHRLNLSPIHLNLLLVVMQLLASLLKKSLQVVNIESDSVCVRAA